MKGLDGVFKDFENNVSFDEITEFNDHIQSTGRRAVIGSLRCSGCLRKFEFGADSPVRCAVDAVNGGVAVFTCDDCLDERIAERERERAGSAKEEAAE